MLKNAAMRALPVLLAGAVLVCHPVDGGARAQPLPDARGSPAGVVAEPSARAPQADEWGAALDAAWPSRDEPGVGELLERKVAESLAKSPDDSEILWRAARWKFWRAELAADDKAKGDLAKEGWEIAGRAVARAPGSVQAHYYAAVNCGTYSEAIGILRALTKGLEGKFRGDLDVAVAKEPGFLGGAPLVALGRYYFRLPWPKHDAKRAVENLEAALKRSPTNLRARLYLAEVLLDEGRAKAALALVNEILAATPGAYDPPEERHVQRLARELKTKLVEEIQ